MAQRAQSTSPKNPQHQGKLEERLWRTPTVLAAIIAAVAAISVAIIGLTTPKLKPPEPTKIEQHTSGPGSPAIGKAGRNVTIIQQQGSQNP
jgi:hypothetical protein